MAAERKLLIVMKITIMGIGSAPCPLLYLDYLIRLGDNDIMALLQRGTWTAESCTRPRPSGQYLGGSRLIDKEPLKNQGSPAPPSRKKMAAWDLRNAD